MNVFQFITRHREDWNRLEELVKLFSSKGEVKPLDFKDFSRLYRSATSDFAYAKTHFPEHDVTDFLNSLVARAHSHIYQENRFDAGTLLHFIFKSVPGLFWNHLNYFFGSLGIFLLFGLGGFLGSEWIPEGEKIFLHFSLTTPEETFGDNAAYIRMTEKNIAKGNPFEVYEQNNRSEMASKIMFNNIRVVLYCFAGGIFAGLVTFWMLAMTGMMIGAFFHIFYRNGIIFDFWNTVMLHGTIELSMIVLGSMAGFMVAKGMLFPGSFPWKESIKVQGKKSIQMAIVIALWLVIAGILESFITGAHLGFWAKIIVNSASISLLVAYWGISGFKNRDFYHEKTTFI